MIRSRCFCSGYLVDLSYSLVTYTFVIIQGGPEKTERHTSHNMWKQSLVAKYEVTSPEKMIPRSAILVQ